jgi:DNA repair protein RecO (recombination protein O)
MTGKIELQPAYVLHSQPFQNTSLLVDLFCLDFGRVRAVARGARRPRARNRSHMQPFQPLLVSMSGRGEVLTLTATECSVEAIKLTGIRLFCGMYMNELLARLLPFHEPHTPLYQSYQRSLMKLMGDSAPGPVLRRFEMALLQELGYALDLEYEGDGETPIVAGAHYHFVPETGFQRIAPDRGAPARLSFSGEELLALHATQFEHVPGAATAKRLLRMALQVHLGNRPLLSQQFFVSMSLSGADDKG